MNIKLLLKQYIKMFSQKCLLPLCYRFACRKPVDPGLIVFADAHHALLNQKFNSFEDQIIAVADYIIGRLNDDHGLLTFISKNLSWGIFKTAFENTLPDESLQFYDYIFEQMKKNSYVCPEPELMLFTIIELVGSTCYSCILYGQPVSVEEYLPYLHTVIRQILAGFLVQQPAQIETKTAS